MEKRLRIALAGNPNSGKTTIFNAITGARQRVANYPGTTVEKKEGFTRHGGRELEVVDLPGTYSLTAYSQDELVARDFLIREKPDAVIDIVDASNLERSLYLAVQLMELRTPLVLAFNMMDVAKQRDVSIDVNKLSALLGIPIVPTVGTRGEGIGALLDTAVAVADRKGAWRAADIHYGAEIEEEIEKVVAKIAAAGVTEGMPPRWVAVKLLEKDEEVALAIGANAPGRVATEQARKSADHLASVLGTDVETALADRRYGFISGACQECVISTVESRHIASDKIDAIVTNRALGIPILLVLMYVVFYAAFRLANAPGDWISVGIGRLSDLAAAIVPADPLEPLSIQSLLVDGIIGGVGSVIVFLPNVIVLFIALAILEDSGYMARAAFVMDNLMHRMGLHGKSFIPMVLGFGCSVPAIMATRIIENRLGRLTTMMVIPLVSCGARLPVYALLIPAFFAPEWRAAVLWLVYMLGVALAISLAKLLRGTVLCGEAHPFVMELPPYRMPTLKGILIHAWEKSSMYLRKAGTVILAVSVLMWFAANWPSPEKERLAGIATSEERHSAVLSESLVGRFGRAAEPVVKPMGFDWKAASALVGATAAKEVFVAQMGIVFGVGESEDSAAKLREKLRASYSTASGLAMLVYLLVASPCLATVAITTRESGSWKWAALQWCGLTAVGYLLAVITYQLTSLIGLGGIAR